MAPAPSKAGGLGQPEWKGSTVQLYEKYRPKQLSEVVGQPKAVAIAQFQIERGFVKGGAFWLTGPTGVGKSSIASIMARSVANPECVSEYNRVGELDAGELDRIGRDLSRPLLFGIRAYIVNEAHGLRGFQIDALNVLLEKSAREGTACWFFTTTWSGEDSLFGNQNQADAFVGRCIKIPLTNQGVCKPFAERLMSIGKAEGLDGLPLARYERAVKESGNNMRDSICYLQSGAMIGGGA